MPRGREYIPALGYNWLTALYDPILRWTMRESVFKRRLVEQARIERGHRVLDLGCGTATLTLLLQQAHPGTQVVGLDGDPKVLRIARAKVTQAGGDIALARAMAFELPHADGAFQRVLSSLLFHHLTRENKLRALREVWRVLCPGGELHIADWGKPRNAWARAAFLLVQLLDGFLTTADNVNGLLPDLLRESGFSEVRETAQFATPFGTLALYQASKLRRPAAAPG